MPLVPDVCQHRRDPAYRQRGGHGSHLDSRLLLRRPLEQQHAQVHVRGERRHEPCDVLADPREHWNDGDRLHLADHFVQPCHGQLFSRNQPAWPQDYVGYFLLREHQLGHIHLPRVSGRRAVGHGRRNWRVVYSDHPPDRVLLHEPLRDGVFGVHCLPWRAFGHAAERRALDRPGRHAGGPQ